MHIFTLIYISLYTHTHTHTYTHTHIHTYTHTHIHTYTYARTHTHTHTHINTYTHTNTQTHTHTYTCMRACMHKYILTFHRLTMYKVFWIRAWLTCVEWVRVQWTQIRPIRICTHGAHSALGAHGTHGPGRNRKELVYSATVEREYICIYLHMYTYTCICT